MAQRIIAYYEQQTQPCSSHEHLIQCLQLLSQLSIKQKRLTTDQLATLNRHINTIPTGRQKRLKQACNETLLYLQAVCGWILPDVKVQQLVERDHRYSVTLYRYSALADSLYRAYQTHSAHQVKQTTEPCLVWTVLTLMIDVAPVPLQVWCQRLNDTTPLECIDKQMVVRFTHPNTLSYFDDMDPTSATHYAMTPLAARVFMRWQQAQALGSPNVTLKRVTRKLNHWLSACNDTSINLTSLQWQHVICSLWLNRFQLPLDVLKDFSDPMRHVSALPRQNPSLSKSFKAYAPTPCSSSAASQKDSRTAHFRTWQHKSLIKHLAASSQPRPPKPAWQVDDLLPGLLFDYVDELGRDGGVKKNVLAQGTIERYTNFNKEFSNAPLPLHIASDRTALNQWAMRVYETLDEHSLDQWRMYQFFRFMIQQPITEHLDLSLFEKPAQNVKVDALTLDPDEIHSVVSQLLNHPYSPLQSLFSAVSAILAYYAKLRRGEVLRLRLQDIRCVTHKGARFDLDITNTDEGSTKSGLSRTVHVLLPEIAAKLVRLVLDMKKTCAPNVPLIGLTHESMTARARHYLLPVTKILKHNFGPKARFHHLRHAGATLLYQQALCIANNQTPEAWFHPERPVTNALLSLPFAQQQFDYWLEGHDFCDMNNMLLFDEVGRELGHQYYATTRLHYLHGMDWVAPAFLPQTRHYSHAELRFILGMKPSSNDIARVLPMLDPHYASLTLQAKKRHTPLVSHLTLTHRLMKHMAVEMNAKTVNWTNEPDALSDNIWLGLWASNLSRLENKGAGSSFRWESQTLLQKIRASDIPFDVITPQWQSFGQYQGITFDNAQRHALQALGDMALIHSETSQLVVHCPCNHKVKKALDVLKQSSLKYRCHITLFQNRKSLESRKWTFIHDHLLTGQDSASKVVIPTGKTRLTITFHLATTELSLLTRFKNWWNTLLLPTTKKECL
jgi:hypothetical protein